MTAQEANKRQLEIWKKTLDHEVAMMASWSVEACHGFIERLDVFGKKLEAREGNRS